LSRKNQSSGWCTGPGNLSQNGLKPISLRTSPTKKNAFQNFPIKNNAT